jgi:hypothetical protein
LLFISDFDRDGNDGLASQTARIGFEDAVIADYSEGKKKKTSEEELLLITCQVLTKVLVLPMIPNL